MSVFISVRRTAILLWICPLLISCSDDAQANTTSGTLNIYSAEDPRANSIPGSELFRSYRITVEDHGNQRTYRVQQQLPSERNLKPTFPVTDSQHRNRTPELATMEIKTSLVGTAVQGVSRPDKKNNRSKRKPDNGMKGERLQALHDIPVSDRSPRVIKVESKNQGKYSVTITGHDSTNPLKTKTLCLNQPPDAFLQSLLELEKRFSRFGIIVPHAEGLPAHHRWVYYTSETEVLDKTRSYSEGWNGHLIDLIVGLDCRYRIRAIYVMNPDNEQEHVLVGFAANIPFVPCHEPSAGNTTYVNLFYQWVPDEFDELMSSTHGVNLQSGFPSTTVSDQLATPFVYSETWSSHTHILENRKAGHYSSELTGVKSNNLPGIPGGGLTKRQRAAQSGQSIDSAFPPSRLRRRTPALTLPHPRTPPPPLPEKINASPVPDQGLSEPG